LIFAKVAATLLEPALPLCRLPEAGTCGPRAHLQTGVGMGKSAIYRKRAQECLKLADKFTSIEIQGCLLSMAYAWQRLAQDKELTAVLQENANEGLN